ncbi:gliding motility-associated ABC transporter ATP-binding subunit GldA [Marivirga atlantica]|uniref:ATP-binding cassette domain-containing protein n=1 Tax=Marivirga atlantica TaxID=1548457 RepID=A0A937DK75_9BACT|nr:ATP-binding cassette domain-containing protein [Marivirga atlantica]MBL0766670.1 ATP-binding cassette domain-containing protein [Marivirga atlantica]
MSIKVVNVVKQFGEQRAVKNISFEIDKGEIVGFLGRNGAGKSTTMKMITGNLPLTEGQIFVNGLDVKSELDSIKSQIGYLPEHNPLYLDMYVHEFLQFCGKVYGIKGQVLIARINEIVAQCGLLKEQNKLIGSLSKGYRQRVGLAQALLHNPSVLILDEPTTGLDPNQIIEIRELIQSISKDKTVLLSTHIMQEVQALCSRAIIIKNGEIVANETVDELTTEEQSHTIKIELADVADLSSWKEKEKILSIQKANKLTYLIKASEDIRKQIFKWAGEEGVDLVGISLEKGSMETVFQKLTKD